VPPWGDRQCHGDRGGRRQPASRGRPCVPPGRAGGRPTATVRTAGVRSGGPHRELHPGARAGGCGLTWPGSADLARATEALAGRLPPELRVLAEIAFNYRWSWLPGGQEVFQAIDISGWQTQSWTESDPDRLPIALVTGQDGAPLTITLPLRGRDVVAQIWRADVGRVPLYFLDTQRPENSQVDRWITARLYIADRTIRQ